MFALKVLAVVCCAVIISGEEEKPKQCKFLTACLKETDGKVTADDVNKIMTFKDEKQIEDVSNDVLCVLKCTLDKRGALVDESIDGKKIASMNKLMEKIDDKDGFIECVEKIKIKKCDDVKGYMRCMLKFVKYD